MPPFINNVLFDLDGTMADTAPDLASSLNQLLREQGRQVLPYEQIRPTVSDGGAYMICKAFQIDEQHQNFLELRDRFLEIYQSHLADRTSTFTEMDHILHQLEMDGIKWGIVTNKSSRFTNPLMQELGLFSRAGCIVCGDTLEQNKPHPAPMIHACKLINKKPAETLYVGDAKRDVEAGLSAGMYTLIACYGYIGNDDNPDSWGASGCVNSPMEILTWLQNSIE